MTSAACNVAPVTRWLALALATLAACKAAPRATPIANRLDRSADKAARCVVSGIVTDRATGDPMRGAIVELKGGDHVDFAISHDDGQFEIRPTRRYDRIEVHFVYQVLRAPAPRDACAPWLELRVPRAPVTWSVSM